MALAVTRADHILVTLVVLTTLALFQTTLTEPTVGFMALARSSAGLSIKDTVTVAIASDSLGTFALESHNARAFGLTGKPQEATLTHTVRLVVLDNAFTMVGTRVTGLVSRALQIACLPDPPRLACAFGIVVTDSTAFAVVRAYVVRLVSRASEEAVVSQKAVVAVALG